jgi:hypothetical protein
MELIVAALVGVLGAIGAIFGLRKKFTKRGYDQAFERQKTQADMVRKEIARKDKAIDSKVQANRVKIQATAKANLAKNTGKAANSFLSRTREKWQTRNK